MATRPTAPDIEHDDVPELEDVAAPVPPQPVPPPNLDLFAGAGIDTDALRDALGAEIDAALAELRDEFERLLRERVAQRVRERLPDIVESVIDGRRSAPE